MTYVLRDIGCEILQHEGAEGDDVVASLVHKFSKPCDCERPCVNCKCAEQDPYNNIIVFSSDRDLNYLLRYRGVSIYRPPSIFYTRQDFIDEFGFNPSLFNVYKSLVGDKSDGIKGVAFWGDARAKKHIEQNNWVETLKKDGTYEEFEHAMALVTLRTDIPNLPDTGSKIVVGGCPELFDKLKGEYHNKDAVDDVIFAEKRLEVACESYSGGNVNEDKNESLEEGLPF